MKTIFSLAIVLCYFAGYSQSYWEVINRNNLSFNFHCNIGDIKDSVLLNLDKNDTILFDALSETKSNITLKSINMKNDLTWYADTLSMNCHNDNYCSFIHLLFYKDRLIFFRLNLHSQQSIIKFKPQYGDCFEGSNKINIYEVGHASCAEKVMGFPNLCNKNEIVVAGEDFACSSQSHTRFIFLYDKSKMKIIQQSSKMLNSNDYIYLSEIISNFKLNNQ